MVEEYQSKRDIHWLGIWIENHARINYFCGYNYNLRQEVFSFVILSVVRGNTD